MSYRWRPTRAQAREFADKMHNDPEYRDAYNQRKQDRLTKRLESSNFDYPSAGGHYHPTKYQHDFCVFDRTGASTPEELDACNIVASAYICNETVHHDYIHIVNELIRRNNSIT